MHQQSDALVGNILNQLSKALDLSDRHPPPHPDQVHAINIQGGIGLLCGVE
jgi:hypothetical protein